MEMRQLGQTGLSVSVIGLGTVKFGRTQALKYPQPFALPSDEVILSLLDTALSLGINLLDTAPAYGSSEIRLGELLGKNRKKWIICSKAGEEFDGEQSYFDFSKAAIRRSVERSLKRLQTDYLDCLLIHSNGDDLKIIQEDEALETLQVLKKEGKIRATGMSSKTLEGGLLAAEHSDVVMLTYHQHNQSEASAIDHARNLKKGVLIKKALQSGHLTKNSSVKAELNWILQNPGVSSIILGTINQAHLKENCCLS